MIKSRKMRWLEHVPHMEEIRNAYKVLSDTGRKEATYKTQA
jgi:hypothetical protein